MKFKERSLREIAEMVVGDADHFRYRSSSHITRFFEECELDYVHDGSTRWRWASDKISELLEDPSHGANTLPERFVHVLRILMDKEEAEEENSERLMALEALNKPLNRQGYDAYYGEDGLLYVRHIGTQKISLPANSNRPFTPAEMKRRGELSDYLDGCSEDELIENILLPMFRQLGFQRITAAGHKDKSLEYGKDVWMKYVLPTQHVLYFGIQAKKGKLDSAGVSKGSNANVAEIYNQIHMMLGHEIFDPEINKKVLVDHAFIVTGGEITKQARNWLGQKLDATKRSQIMFMDRDDLLNIYTANSVPLPSRADPSFDDDIPF